MTPEDLEAQIATISAQTDSPQRTRLPHAPSEAAASRAGLTRTEVVDAERVIAVARALRAGDPVADGAFDAIYPPAVRALSRTFWTPVTVARRAAEALVSAPGTRVLDIGSGVGKFCLIGALATKGVFVGLEHRRSLVEVARCAAASLEAWDARFVEGAFGALDPAAYDAAYLYNPFGENLDEARWQIDASVELTPRRFSADVIATRRFLSRLRVGARVATFHGFGGTMPSCFRRLTSERHHNGFLEIWEQGAVARDM